MTDEQSTILKHPATQGAAARSRQPAARRPRGWRRLVFGWWWALAVWLGRRPRATQRDYARQDYRSQTRLLGLRFSERLRDRLRRGWLRVRD